MGKYKIIKDLGLQVFTKPLGPDTMLVSADDLADRLRECAVKIHSDSIVLELIIKNKPKTLQEKIIDVLSDHTVSENKALERIRKLVEG